MGRLLKAVLKLLKGKVKIHIGSPGGPGIDINFDKKPGILPLTSSLAEQPVNFNLWIGLWKATKSALLSTLTVLVAAGGIDRFFEVISASIPGLGFPIWSVPVVLAAWTLLRNLVKQSLNSLPKE